MLPSPPPPKFRPWMKPWLITVDLQQPEHQEEEEKQPFE